MNRNQKSEHIKNLIPIMLIAIATTVTAYMLIQMQYSINIILFWISLAFIILLGSALIVLKFFKYERIYKLGIVILLVSLFIIGVFYTIFKLGYIELLDNVELLRDEIAKTGSIHIAFVILQFAQVCILPIPATVTTILGLLLFDPIDAIVYSLIGMISGAVVMFYFGKFAGRKAVDWALGKEDVQKYLDIVHGKDNAILTAMFLLPIFPDDILCAVAGIVQMNTLYFIIVLTISRISSTVVTVLFFSGNFIPLYGWWLGIWGILIGVLIFATVMFFKNIDKIENKIRKISAKFSVK
ncbi:MAG: VTT domain-containing protein [Bacillota bacterium]